MRLSEKYREGGKPSDAEIETWLKEHPTTSNRIAFFDFQCSAQKSVSIMAITFGDSRLIAAHEEAVLKAFGELEKFAARQTGNRATTTTGNVLAAAFTHTSSRTLDAQLHSHLVVANVTQDPGGNRYALTEVEMCRAIRYAGKVYQNEMAHAVQSLGYGIELAKDSKGRITGFEIAGVTAEMRERQSTRSTAIEAAARDFAQKHGREPSAAERRVLTLESRGNKLVASSKEANEAAQRSKYTASELQELERLKETALSAVNLERRETDPVREAQAVEYARSHLFERSSVKAVHEVLAEALNAGMGQVSLQGLRHAMHRDENFVALLGEQETAKVTTRSNLDLEAVAVANCKQRQNTEQPFSLVSALGDLSAWTRQNRGFELTEQQRAALAHVLTSPDGVLGIRGVAGAGKTTLLQELDFQLSARGAQMLYLAPTASAVETLRAAGFGKATTVAKYMADSGVEPDAFKGKFLFVDEAGLQSTRQGHDVQMLAGRLGQRICLIGDTRQHSSVEAGDYMRILEKHGELSSGELTHITRQKPRDYREAIEAFAAGQHAEGWKKLDEMKAINSAESSYLQAATTDFLTKSDSGRNLDNILCVSPTHAELDTLNTRIREGLKSCGYLAGNGRQTASFRSAGRTNAQKRDAKSYAPGDVILFPGALPSVVKMVNVEKQTLGLADGKTINLKRAPVTKMDVGTLENIELAPNDKILIRANDKRSGLVNGQILTVEALGAEGDIKTREGFTLPSTFVNWRHGYAVTSHASQSKTVDHVIVAAAALDSKALYVSASRGRHSVAIHCADKDFIGASLRDGSRPAALDLAKAQAQLYSASITQKTQKTRELEQVKKQRARLAEQQRTMSPEQRLHAARSLAEKQKQRDQGNERER